MSVIFKTLKKLKTESEEKENGKNNLLRRKRIHFFKNPLYPPSAVLLAFLILTVIGSGTLFGYYHLREKRSGNTKVVTVPKTDMEQSAGEDTLKSSEINGSKSLNREKDSESNRIEYLPPQENDNNDEVYTSKLPKDIQVSSIADKKKSLKAMGTIEKNTTAKAKTKNSDRTKTEEVLPVPEVEKIFLDNAKKNAKIARLVGDIRLEMEHGNNEQIEKLFDELSTLKGQDNSYVLKLKAVWHIHSKEFERAEDLLKTVLSKNEHDQEAGINMAIIEIKTKQMQKAYERLKNLREIYPENIRIAEIIQNIKPLLNKTRIRHLVRDDKL
jgi:tetratricopeptide (TPR) repeat protein